MKILRYTFDPDRYQHIEVAPVNQEVFDSFQRGSLASEWQPVAVTLQGTRLPVADLMRISARVPVLTIRALHVLDAYIPTDVERLKIVCPDVELYALNFVTRTKSLIVAQSDANVNSAGNITDIKWGIFRESEIGGRGMFTIEKHLSVFMTESFYQKIKVAKLTGLIEHPVGETV
jgi:hypothetical protein